MKTRQSRRYAKNPRDKAVFRGYRPSGSLFLKNKKTRFQIWSRGEGVPNFRSGSFFVVAERIHKTDRPTYLRVKIGISSTSCLPHVDFDIFLTDIDNTLYYARKTLLIFFCI